MVNTRFNTNDYASFKYWILCCLKTTTYDRHECLCLSSRSLIVNLARGYTSLRWSLKLAACSSLPVSTTTLAQVDPTSQCTGIWSVTMLFSTTFCSDTTLARFARPFRWSATGMEKRSSRPLAPRPRWMLRDRRPQSMLPPLMTHTALEHLFKTNAESNKLISVKIVKQENASVILG